MSYIILIYGLSITWLLLAFMQYKRSGFLEKIHIKGEKISIISSLLIKPVLFTVVAWGLNTIEEQLGFWLIGGTHLVIIIYCMSHFFFSAKKQTLLLTE